MDRSVSYWLGAFHTTLKSNMILISHLWRKIVVFPYSTAAKGCFWEMTPTGSITRYHLFFLIEDPMGYVESVVVEKLIWSRT